jgi:tetratricopeptide (TPR) repeat protein
MVSGTLLLAGALWPEPEVLASLDAACHARLLVEQGEDYQFAHDLIREVVLSDLSAMRRVSLHWRVAEALERSAGEPALERLAYHYARAGVLEKAVVYLAQAGERAQAMYAHADAEQAYQEYVQHLDTMGWQVESAQGREWLATVQVLRARFNAALEVLEVALETYRRVRDVEGQRRVLAQVAQIHRFRGTPQQGLALLLPRLADLCAGIASPGLAALEAGLVQLYYGAGRYQEQLAAAERAVQLARTVGEERLLLRAYHGYSLALDILERWEEALSVLDVQQHLAERLGDLDQLARAHNNRAFIAGDRGEFPASLSAFERAVEAAEQLGDPTLLSRTLGARSLIRFLTGDWQAAHADVERAVTLLGPIEQSELHSCTLWALGQLALAQEQSQGQPLLEEALTQAQQSGGDLEVQRGVQAALAERDLLQGRPASARARLEPLLDRTADPERGVAPLLPLLAWAAADLGEDTQAAALLARSFERAGQHYRLVAVEAYRTQAWLCIRQQRWDEAQAALEEALARCRAMPAPYAEAKALAVYGRLHRAKGEPALARERLETALAILQRLGERLYAEQVEQALVLLKRSG